MCLQTVLQEIENCKSLISSAKSWREKAEEELAQHRLARDSGDADPLLEAKILLIEKERSQLAEQMEKAQLKIICLLSELTMTGEDPAPSCVMGCGCPRGTLPPDHPRIKLGQKYHVCCPSRECQRKFRLWKNWSQNNPQWSCQRCKVVGFCHIKLITDDTTPPIDQALPLESKCASC